MNSAQADLVRLLDVPRLIQTKRQAVNSAISELPIIPDDHVAALHTEVVRSMARDLTREISGLGQTHKTLVNRQTKLMEDLSTALPLVVQLFKKDEEHQRELKTSDGQLMSNVDERTKLWIDDLIERREE